MTQAVWDPVDGEAKATMPEPMEYRKHPLEGFVRSLSGPMILLALVGFGIGIAAMSFGWLSEIWGVIGFGMFAFGLCFVLFGSGLTQMGKNQRALIANAIRASGFVGGTKMDEAKIRRLAERIKSLLVLRVGGSVPIILEYELWGKTQKDVPFWMGMSLTTSTGGQRSKANVSHDATSSHGEFAMFIVAYRLDRDTRIHAEIMPEFATAKGPLDKDVKTESTEFNAKFNIRLRKEDGKDVGEGVSSAALLQVLTPATQATLIGLADTYAARVIIDRDTVFFGGYRNFQTTDHTALERLLTKAIEDFAEAATAFKRYAE